jgi:MYXO-CTERM domain-containing protein
MPLLTLLGRLGAAAAVAAAGTLFAASALASGPSPTDTLVLGPPTNPAAPTWGNALRDENDPAIASNGAGALVVWTDGWNTGPTANPLVVCARYDAKGSLLDSPPIALSLHGAPSVVWDGIKYLVVAGGSAQQVDPATGAADPVSPFPGAQGFTLPPALASGGGALVSLGSTTSGVVEASIVDSTGHASTVTLGHTTPYVTVAVGYASGEFLAAWVDGTLLKAARISTAGAVLDTTPITIAGAAAPVDGGVAPAPGRVDVAGSSAGFLVSWMNGTISEVRAARVGANGSVADPEGILLATNSGFLGPHAVWNGSAWWVTWITSGPMMLAESINANGQVVAASELANPVFASHFVEATAGSTAFFAWDNGGVIMGQVVSFAGASFPPRGLPALVSRFPDPQTNAKVFASSDGYLVAWSSTDALLGMRFTSAGKPIDAAPVALQGTPIGALGDSYVLVGNVLVGGGWYTQFTALTLPASSDAGAGTQLATFGYANDPYAQKFLGGACAADRCAIVWLDTRIAYGAQVTVVGAGGGTVASNVSIQISTPAVTPVSAASDGTSFLLGLDSTIVPVSPTGAIGGFEMSPAPIATVAAGGGQLAWFTSGSGISEYLYQPASSADAGSDAEADAESDASAAPSQTFLPNTSTSNVQVAWDGRAFLTAVTANNQAMGTELPAFGAAGASPQTFEVAANGGSSVAAIPSASSAVFVSTPAVGPFAIPSLTVRWVSFSPEAADGGTDAGDGGELDAGDAGPADAAPTEAGADAGLADGGAVDASGKPDASAQPDASLHTEGGSGADASTPGSTGDTSGTSGCGCSTAGSGQSIPWMLVPLGLLGALARRRRRR